MGEDRENLLETMRQRRGYQLPFHALLAEADPEFLAAYETLVSATYTAPRLLDRREKELVYVAILTAIGSDLDHVVAHMRAAVAAGASEQELLEVVELTLPPAGVPSLMRGCDAWRRAFRES